MLKVSFFEQEAQALRGIIWTASKTTWEEQEVEKGRSLPTKDIYINSNYHSMW